MGKNSGVASPIIGGGGKYSYIRALRYKFLLKSIVFTVCEHEHMNIRPPPPAPQFSTLATPLGKNTYDTLFGPRLFYGIKQILFTS